MISFAFYIKLKSHNNNNKSRNKIKQSSQRECVRSKNSVRFSAFLHSMVMRNFIFLLEFAVLIFIIAFVVVVVVVFLLRAVLLLL